jgi:hypothetical protein
VVWPGVSARVLPRGSPGMYHDDGVCAGGPRVKVVLLCFSDRVDEGSGRRLGSDNLWVHIGRRGSGLK